MSAARGAIAASGGARQHIRRGGASLLCKECAYICGITAQMVFAGGLIAGDFDLYMTGGICELRQHDRAFLGVN